MKNINAFERGRTAFGRNKNRQPMNDAVFVANMYAEVEESEEVPSTVKSYYITQWKSGYDAAKTEAEAPVKPKPTKKKAKKKAKKKVAKKKVKK